MAPKKRQDFRGISLKRELVDEIEKFVKEFPKYKSKADFVHEAVRVRMEQIRRIEEPRLSHFNLTEHGVRIQNPALASRYSPKGMIVDVYFKPGKAWCEFCNSENCDHVNFAIALPEVQEIFRKRGWNLPEP